MQIRFTLYYVTLPLEGSARSNLKVTDGCPSSQENTTSHYKKWSPDY